MKTTAGFTALLLKQVLNFRNEKNTFYYLLFAKQKYSSSKEFKFGYASQKFQGKKVELKIPLWQKIFCILLHLK